MSPRRSSRAKAATSSQPAHTNSSNSSISSRAERSTRSSHKLASPHRSHPREQSFDDTDDTPKPPARRTRSGHDEIKAPTKAEVEDELEDEEEEEEVTRCVCGQTEYPGLPEPTLELLKLRAKENGIPDSSEIVPDETGTIFIQCDICKVWQHGGCVGILDDDTAPDEYFCEECRKDLHDVSTTAGGQRFSRYLPLQNIKLDSPTPPDSMKRSKENRPRASAEALMAKRRPTMNSYDEQEQLRRAIEESKKEGIEASRRSKRSRSDSDEKGSAKRARTGSNSASPDSEKEKLAASSSDEALAAQKLRDPSPKRIRGAAARNHRDKEMRDRREKEKAEAAQKRSGRAERRRGDEPEPVDSPPVTTTMSPPPTADALRNKKLGKPAPKGRRTGRNQYTKESLGQASLEPTDESRMRTRSRSRSVARDGDSPPRSGQNGISSSHLANSTPTHAAIGSDGKPSRPKHMNVNKTSFNDMKKRVHGIMEFINKASDEGDKSEEKEEVKPPLAPEGDDSMDWFASLSAQDMMKVLRQKLVNWDNEYGHLGKA